MSIGDSLKQALQAQSANPSSSSSTASISAEPWAVFVETCWESSDQVAAQQTWPDQGSITAASQNLVESITGSFRRLLRPNAEYSVEIETADAVSGVSNPYPRTYELAFRTKGPIGHFHRFHDAGAVVEHPVYAADPSRFALDRLQPYVDIVRSYPAPDGNLVGAKPLFYGVPDLRLFFVEQYVERFFSNWAELGPGLPAIDSSLELEVIDPIEPVEPVGTGSAAGATAGATGADADGLTGLAGDGVLPTLNLSKVVFLVDPAPVPPAAVEMIASMVNNGPECSGPLHVGSVPASLAAADIESLRPSAMLTAQWRATFDGHTETVLDYPFQTSRYADHAAQVHSYVEVVVPAPPPDSGVDANTGGVPATPTSMRPRARVFPVLTTATDFSAVAQIAAGNSPPDLQTAAASPYDQLISIVFGVSGLPTTVGTEFISIVDAGGATYGVLVRNPEPLNDPRLPLPRLTESVAAPGLTALVAPDVARVVLVRADGSPLTPGELEVAFTYWRDDGKQVVAESVEHVLIEIATPPTTSGTNKPSDASSSPSGSTASQVADIPTNAKAKPE